MAAPQLLDKKTLNAEVATQKAHQVKEGLALARKVDALRETKVTEEQSLEAFRTGMIAKIQQEIDAKIREKDFYEEKLPKLRDEYQKLLTPPDLTAKWEEIAGHRNELQVKYNEIALQVQELNLGIAANISRERENKEESQRLVTLREEIGKLSTRADTKFTNASDILERAQKQAEKVITEAQHMEARLKVREEDATNREIYLSKEEKRIQTWEVDLAAREKKLKSRQEVFIKSQNYLKNKKL